ncbi:TonB-dependent receptor [Methylobacterium sp. E-005]|uniref:TonB-dependent receptor n=1 Tax=Methylobacterium sp. E-005 TaxID=2836549 RepID=UPI001FB95AF0|nr:TonB-dependent receptor [Methylobacterium sp. E-005]MCJ2086029.1 TonB-dependent receptor [Methylobacterium sp. E-005]
MLVALALAATDAPATGQILTGRPEAADPVAFRSRGSAPPDMVMLDAVSVESRGGAAKPGFPPPTGTVGQPPAAFAGGQVAGGGRVGFLGSRSVFDTPFTQANYTAELIRNQQARSVGDVLANNASVRETQPPYSAQRNIIIRGFPVNAKDFAFDGLYGLVSVHQPALDGIERVEVLSGPGAFLYGFPPSGSAVGVVNLVPKRAAEAPLTRVEAQFLSAGTVGGSFDVGRRFGDGNAVGIRINGAYRDGATPIDHLNQGAGALTLGLDYRGEALRLSLDAGYQHLAVDAQSNGFTVNPGFRIPRAPRLSLNVQQPWERAEINQGFGVLRAEYDLTPDMTLFGAVGGSRADRDFFGSNGTITSGAGAVQLQTGRVAGKYTQWSGEAGLRTHFQTGPVDHGLAVVATHYAGDEPFYRTGIGLLRTSLYAPVLYPPPDRPARRLEVTTRSDLDGVAVTDTASILDGRFQGITRDLALPQGGSQSRYDKSAATPVAALIVKPWDKLSLYASYAEGFGFGPSAPAQALNASATLPPAVTSQIETGAKLDLDPVGVTLAVFEIKQPFGTLEPRTRVFGLNGEQTNQGLDFNVFGAPTEGVRVLAGLTLIDGRLGKTAGGSFDGHVAPGVPTAQANLGGELDLPPWLAKGVTLTGLVIYTAPQYYDQANRQKIPDYTRLDLGIRYSFVAHGMPLTARFNVENAAGARYWASAGAGVLSYGTPRTFLASLTADL